MVKITKQAKIECLHELMEFVSNNALRHGFSQQKIKEIELVTEEVLMNIINYAYEDNAGDIEINCWKDNDKRFITKIVDTGKHFDVLSGKEPDLTSDIDEREVGGLGLFFMKQFMDDVQYQREEGKNILTLVVQQD